jgi:hypothetical protein
MFKRLLVSIVAVSAVGGMSACRVLPLDNQRLQLSAISSAPYPQSKLITGVDWKFSSVTRSRKALGSDLWPCTWARDGNQYCAWGDGGGFEGNDDQVGRVSLGFARLTGVPRGNGSRGFAGKNVWGSPPYAEEAAIFGGKVLSLVSAGGNLYAIGAFWTSDACSDPVHKSGAGPLYSMAWSSDLGKTWKIAPWSAPSMLGSFLNVGKDNAAAPEAFIYLYYLREGDRRHLFLKRVAQDQLLVEPSVPGTYSYLTGMDADGRAASWSTTEAEAGPIFADSNQVDYPDVVYDARLHRYLMTAGHYRSGDYSDASVGQFGLFESRTPWGPWSTVAYYDDWGDYGVNRSGDFLGMHMPLNWHSANGKTRWFVFSGLHELDSFNLIKATFHIHRSAH